MIGCDHSSLTDDQLMVRLQTGESRAFDTLVERYQGQLLGFFFRNTRDRQLSEDLTQETFLRLHNQSWDFLPVGKFRGWLYRLARNLLIDNVRRQSHDALIKAVTGKQEDEEDGLARLTEEVLSPDSHADIREMASIVDDMLRQLPEEQRLTFLLHHYGGLTLAEVADAMEANVPTTKSRLRLAREKLQEKLRARGIDG
ncbi:MAG: sigW 7 [Planctomycetaceae bacterium]|nr:sigW 7 [Planctomycetaceae bacterium]